MYSGALLFSLKRKDNCNDKKDFGRYTHNFDRVYCKEHEKNGLYMKRFDREEENPNDKLNMDASNLLGVILIATAAVLCAVIDTILKEEIEP